MIKHDRLAFMKQLVSDNISVCVKLPKKALMYDKEYLTSKKKQLLLGHDLEPVFPKYSNGCPTEGCDWPQETPCCIIFVLTSAGTHIYACHPMLNLQKGI